MSKWDARIEKAEKFLEKSRMHGRQVYTRYSDDRLDDLLSDAQKANIFYSNVNTLKESLFNSLPKPDVSRAHRSDFQDDASRVAATILQRGLEYETHCAVDFKAAVRGAILDRLVPGIGQVWIRFGVETDEEGSPMAGSEAIFVEQVYWEDFIYEPARNWADVGWVGRRLELKKSEVVERWGEDAASNMQSARDKDSVNTPKQILEGKYFVYEIWDKKTRKVFHISKGAEEPLDEKDDPYQLKDFFPCPCPLVANLSTNAFLPVTDYHISQDQYNQLDVLYARMSCIVTAIKVAGLYDASSPEIGGMLDGQENQLIPVQNWAMFVEKGGAAGGIQWYPVEQVATVLQLLQAQFEAVKAILFEVSGMSDIMRGSTNQYETAAAQQIKAQFASTRMNGYQRDVSEFVTSILNIMGEMMVQLYSDQKLQAIVGKLPEPDMALVPQAVPILRNDLMLSYRVTIQADSLTQADWALEKGQKMELMGYVSQFLASAVPAVQANPDMASLLMGMLKFAITGYKGSSEIEGMMDAELDKLMQAAQQPKQPPPPSPEQIKAQSEQQKMQMEMQQSQQEGQMRMAEGQQSMQIEQMKTQAKVETDMAALQMKQQANEQELMFKREMHMMELEMMERKLQYMEREQTIKLQASTIEAEMNMVQSAQSHAMNMNQADMNHMQKMEQAEEASEGNDD